MSRLRLSDVEWKEFNIGGEFGLFKVCGTITTHPSNLQSFGNTPRVTCSATNNAVENFYRNIPTEKGGVLTVDSATEGYVSYQLNDFIATDHVEKIFLEDKEINKYVGLFLKSCIDKSKLGKYGYGYKFSQKRISRQKILLPSLKDGSIDFEYEKVYNY